MMKLNMLSFKVSQVSVVNQVFPKNATISISINHTIATNHKAKKCKCSTKVELFPEEQAEIEDKTFWVSVISEAVFNLSSDVSDVDELNKATLAELYPHIRATVASIMSASNIQPIFLGNFNQ